MDKFQVVSLAAAAHMKSWGLTGWTFKFDNAKGRLGCCSYRKREIRLSRHFVELNFDNTFELKDTILHEIAHALVGPGKGHGWEWKEMCRLVGAQPKACSERGAIELPKGKVQGNCNCKTHYRHRMPKRGMLYHCRSCRGPVVYRRVG